MPRTPHNLKKPDWLAATVISVLLGVFAKSLSAQNIIQLNSWSHDAFASGDISDNIASSTPPGSIAGGKAKLTLSCRRTDADGHTKNPSSIDIVLELSSTQFDVDVQQIANTHWVDQLCPNLAAAGNPYAPKIIPCMGHDETYYTTQRNIYLKEKEGQSPAKKLSISVAEGRIQSLTMNRDLAYLRTTPAEKRGYGFESRGVEFAVEFSTAQPSVRHFIEACSTPSLEQAKILKAIAEKEAADLAATASYRQAAAAASKRYYELQAYLGLDHDAQRNNVDTLWSNHAITAYKFDVSSSPVNVEDVSTEPGFDQSIVFPSILILKTKTQIPAENTCALNPAGGNVTVINGVRYVLADCSQNWLMQKPNVFDPSNQVLIPAITVRNEMQ